MSKARDRNRDASWLPGAAPVWATSDDGPVTLVSWGAEDNTTQSIASTPKVHAVNTIPSSTCVHRLAECFDLDATQHFCTVAGKEGQAYGDAGGAVVSAGGVLRGLISGNPSCVGDERVALEVEIAAFGEWISKIVG